ncbi:MAG: succinate dehydrogenase, hydrophobic membrane anchor protein [Chloroflexota bacterium]
MATKSRSLPLSKRGLNFEMLMWIFTRLTALAMYALILFAIIGALVMGARNQMNLADVLRWGFMPNSTHVQSTDVPDLEPWSTPFWRLTASALLLVAVAHGVHGLVVIADDYIVSHGGRNVVRIISIAFMLAMMGIGLYILWTS